MLAVARLQHPTVILLENVPAFLHKKHSQLANQLIDGLTELQYDVNIQVIDSSPVSPQKRKRLFIAAAYVPHAPIRSELTIRPNLRCRALTAILDHSPDKALFLSKVQQATLAKRKWRIWHWQQAGDIYPGLPKPWTPPIILRFGVHTKAPTILSTYQRYPTVLLQEVDGRIRWLSVRECARLMGFPDTFEFPVSNKQAYRQLGNAVVVPLATELIRNFTRQLLWSNA